MEKISRRCAREHTLIAVFQALFQPEEIGEIILLSREMEEFPLDAYGEELLRTVIRNQTEIDCMISDYLKKWKLNRLPKINLAILRLAVAEMRFYQAQEDKDSIVINEAVELAKKYAGDAEDYQFINGVLGAISRNTAKNKEELC